MAPSTPHDSLYTVTPGASAYRPDAEPESEPKAASGPVFQCREPGSGCLSMPVSMSKSMSMSIVHFTCLYFTSHIYKVGRSPGPKGGSWRCSLVPLAG